MKKMIIRAISLFLCAVLMTALAGCTPGEQKKEIAIDISGVAPGASLSSVSVSVSYQGKPLEFTTQWGVARGDEIHTDGMGDVFTAPGYYQLSVIYTMPKDTENGEGIPVVSNADSGELTETKALGNNQYLATFGYYFAEDPSQETTAETQQAKVIDIQVSGVALGATFSSVKVGVTCDGQSLDFTTEWGIARGDEIHSETYGDVFQAPGYYQLSVYYTIPEELLNSDGEGIPVITNAGDDVRMDTKAVEGNRYLATFGYYFPEAQCEHNWQEKESFHSCTEGRVLKLICESCENRLMQFLDPTEHTPDWDNAEVDDATCSEPGCRTAICIVCGESVSEELPATGQHKYKQHSKTGSCEDGWAIKYICKDCGLIITESKAPGHAWGAAGYFNNHSHIYICSVCGEEKREAHRTDSSGKCVVCGTYIVN